MISFKKESVMDFKRFLVLSLVTAGLSSSTVFASGCSFMGGLPPSTGSGFIRKETLEYHKIAVLPFKGDTKGEAADTFTQVFHEKFQTITLVERKQVLEMFEERTLYTDQLSEATRREIGKVFGVQAVIVGNVYYPSILRWLLQVQIIDVETGDVQGRSMVEIEYAGAEGVKDACRIAVQNLKPR
jgi:TolB-like protein